MHGLGSEFYTSARSATVRAPQSGVLLRNARSRRLCKAVERERGDPDFCKTFIKTRPHLFSNLPVFLTESDVAGMLALCAPSRPWRGGGLSKSGPSTPSNCDRR